MSSHTPTLASLLWPSKTVLYAHAIVRLFIQLVDTWVRQFLVLCTVLL
jgi:hypothetical protein